MDLVVSVGGSVAVPSVGSGRVSQYAAVLAELDDAGNSLGVVVGGGPTAREYIQAGRELGANEIELDQLGVAATRLNARLLAGALGERAMSSPPTDHDTAREAIRRGAIPVMGGTVAGHTTDAVATALAEHTDADLLVYATSVAGVYDGDPQEDETASRFDRLTPTELIETVADIEMTAGSNAPVDLLAAKLLQRSGLRAIVVDGTDPEAVARAVDGTHDGTEIVPDAGVSADAGANTNR